MSEDELKAKLPNPFNAGPEVFIKALLTAFPPERSNLQPAFVSDVLREVLDGTNSWPEFNRKVKTMLELEKDKNRLAALDYIDVHAYIAESKELGKRN